MQIAVAQPYHTYVKEWPAAGPVSAGQAVKATHSALARGSLSSLVMLSGMLKMESSYNFNNSLLK